MTHIQLAELTAFVAVAEHRSFTKAAAQVGIALPTMSQTIPRANLATVTVSLSGRRAASSVSWPPGALEILEPRSTPASPA